MTKLMDPRNDNRRHELARLDVATPGALRRGQEANRSFGSPQTRKRPRIAGDLGDTSAMQALLEVGHRAGLWIDETLLDLVNESVVVGRDVVVAVDYKDSAATNVTSTTGVNITSLQVTPMLKSGRTYVLFCVGVVAGNAPSTDFIFASAHVDGDQGATFGWSDTGTVGGERPLPFCGFKAGVAGTGATVTMAAHHKVGSGTGTLNTGAILGVAVETG